MKQLLQSVLQDPATRGDKAVNVAASQAAAEFGPWATVEN